MHGNRAILSAIDAIITWFCPNNLNKHTDDTSTNYFHKYTCEVIEKISGVNYFHIYTCKIMFLKFLSKSVKKIKIKCIN